MVYSTQPFGMLGGALPPMNMAAPVGGAQMPNLSRLMSTLQAGGGMMPQPMQPTPMSQPSMRDPTTMAPQMPQPPRFDPTTMGMRPPQMPNMALPGAGAAPAAAGPTMPGPGGAPGLQRRNATPPGLERLFEIQGLLSRLGGGGGGGQTGGMAGQSGQMHPLLAYLQLLRGGG